MPVERGRVRGVRGAGGPGVVLAISGPALSAHPGPALKSKA